MKAEQFTDVCTYHGEGPIWDSVAGRLRWVDMLDGDILTMEAGGSIGRQHVDKIAAAMRPRAGGGLVVGAVIGLDVRVVLRADRGRELVVVIAVQRCVTADLEITARPSPIPPVPPDLLPVPGPGLPTILDKSPVILSVHRLSILLSGRTLRSGSREPMDRT